MRDLNECTAEVFRRSEQRLKERRRKRGRALAVCIPLCLIAVVWSVVGLPAMTPEGGALGQDRFSGEAAGNAPESIACPYTAVEIQNTGLFPEEHYGKVTDTVAVAEIFQAVQSLFAEADGSGTGQNAADNRPAEEANGPHDFVEAPGKSKEYTITLTAGDGAQAVYHLNGHILLNVDTNETIFLSDSQMARLMAALGVSE